MRRRRHALRGFTAFRRVLASGRRIDGSLIRCFVLLEAGPSPGLKVGYAVSHRAYNAVLRNRLRRLMREAFASQRDSLLDALVRCSTSASIVFAVRSSLDARRLKLHPVAADIERICVHLRTFL